MVTYEEILAQLMPLSTLEKAFRYVYENNIPCSEVKINHTLRAVFGDDANSELIFSRICHDESRNHHLSEITIFHPEADTILRVHPRFRPSISHSHDFFEIQYVLAGEFEQTIQDRRITLRQGDFCFIAPELEHDLHVNNEDTIIVNLLIRKRIFPDAFLNILSSSNVISNFFMRILYTNDINPFLINHTGEDENIRFLIANLLNTQRENSQYTSYLVRSQFEQLFLYILKDHSLDFSPGSDRKDIQRMTEILLHIQSNFATVTLDEVAKKFGFNKSYLSRKIHEYTGKSFSAIVHDLRFNRAVHLLDTTNSNIEEIIHSVGFHDRTFFYRKFKDRYGVSPAEFRTLSRKHGI